VNDAEVISAVKSSYAEIHMNVPLDAVVRRGKRLRAHRRLPGLAGAAGTVAALALAAAALVPGSGRTTAPGGSTRPERLAAWTLVSQPDGGVRVALRGAGVRDVAGLQDKLRSDGIPARVTHIGYLRSALTVPGCHVFGDWGGPGGISYALWHKIFYGPHTGQQSNNAFWVYRSAIPHGLGVLVDIYYDGTFGLYVVKASPECTGT
jgi:hypothetical protein